MQDFKNEPIKLFWYQHDVKPGNFGDELNPYIVQKISTNTVQYVNLMHLNANSWLQFKVILKSFSAKEISLRQTWQYFLYNNIQKPKLLLAIGSVLQYNKYTNSIVWGSGIIHKKYAFANSDFRAVRGKYTQARVRELGYNAPDVLGDPALLLPLIYTPKQSKKYKIGIIPHYIHYEEYKKRFSNQSNILVINVLQEVEAVLDEIMNCDCTLSTSLHGIIVSHAYGIPSLWVDFKITDKKLFGDNIKFYDYFSSLDIKEYDTVYLLPETLADIDNILQSYEDVLLPDPRVLKQVQQNLLKAAPFPLKKEFQE